MKNFIKNKEILITGGTGSLGQTLTKLLLKEYKPKGIRIYSRDELKQWQMRQEINNLFPDAPIAYLIGDIRDAIRLHRAMRGVDMVIHTGALKQVTACEDNPIEAIKTNIDGAKNVLNIAIDCSVEKVMNVSTDKAVFPINLYGATKMAAEKLFIHGNIYTGGHKTKISCCRYGNVLASRGSVAHVFQEQIKQGKTITVAHPDATRFFITLPAVARFLLSRISDMQGGEIFVPLMKSINIFEMALAMGAKGKDIKIIGLASGEKLHEILYNENEFAYLINKQYYQVYHIPKTGYLRFYAGKGNLESNNNPQGFLTRKELLEMMEDKI